jgi:hypothetical protein
MSTKFWSENVKGKDHLGDESIDGRMILKCILKTRLQYDVMDHIHVAKYEI